MSDSPTLPSVQAAPESIIRVMPDALANKIAAGEVVQRPASAAKELMENALDAGATRVELHLKASGRELIQVVDNGCGMGPEDAKRSFLRHATSKIRAVEDLESLHTLGFRGEALASIAAVAQVTLRTRRRTDAVGYQIELDGGSVYHEGPCSAPEGTSVSVRNLFFNVPARRNFLKSPATEFKHLVETFQFLALSNPHAAFVLTHNGHSVYALPEPAKGTARPEALRQRIVDLFGANHRQHLIQVDDQTSYVAVMGWVSDVHYHKRSRGEQYLFINNRFVRNRYLDHAVKQAYGTLLGEKAYPFYTLFLSIDPRHVDINVHPTKLEVKFDDERGMYGYVQAVVKKALDAHSLTPSFEEAQAATDEQTAARIDASKATPIPSLSSAKLPSSSASLRDRPKASTPTKLPTSGRPKPSSDHQSSERASGLASSDVGTHEQRKVTDTFMLPGEISAQLFDTRAAEEAHTALELQPSAPSVQRKDLTALPRMQLMRTWIVLDDATESKVFDQQAMHESVLYAQAVQSMEEGTGATQQLLFPQTIDLTPAQHHLLRELEQDVRNLGFDFAFFSGRSVVLRGVPTSVHQGGETNLLQDVLDQYAAQLDDKAESPRTKVARSMARRHAVRKGAVLRDAEMLSMVKQWQACGMPTHTPFGDSVVVTLTADVFKKLLFSGSLS